MAQDKHLEEFLNAVRGVHSTGGGTKETSFYTALNNLLDGVGHHLELIRLSRHFYGIPTTIVSEILQRFTIKISIMCVLKIDGMTCLAPLTGQMASETL